MKTSILLALASLANVQTSVSTGMASVSSSVPSTTSVSPCEKIAAAEASYVSLNPSATSFPSIPATAVLACLESVPISVNNSLAFLEYLLPYIEFQSTLAYLKNPPTGYTLPGVDILGGLETISTSLQSGNYTSQWDFEKDLYTLINILPHDFHLTLSLPLLSLFSFSNLAELVSVSANGLDLPQPYFLTDLEQLETANTTLTWKPSPIVLIDGNSVTDTLLYESETTTNYQDPDANYNNLFFTPATQLAEKGDGYLNGPAHYFGFSSANTTFTFANGSTQVMPNIAKSKQSFIGLDSGAAVFSAFELLPTSTPSATPSATSSPVAKPTTSVPLYPSPVVLHPKAYVGGYFLPNSSIAVLSINSFESFDQTDVPLGDQQQQNVIQTFLTKSKAAGKTKLIIDLSGNGGGSIWNGYDAFKQLFPALQPFAAARYRLTPLVDYIGAVYSASDSWNVPNATSYNIQGLLDVNENNWASWEALAGPDPIYGDNFTNLVRYNFSDPTLPLQNGIIVTGYQNRTNIEQQTFAAADMVLLYDGLCGSTCAVFSELMKSQGGVRSIALGGRPQYAAMQGVAGSKGSQNLEFSNIQSYIAEAAYYEDTLPNNTNLPPKPPKMSIPSLENTPLGLSFSGGINLRNNYHSADPSIPPLQFVYEATNCRLFYTPADIFSAANAWERVANVVWGDGTCVKGSSINADNSFPQGAYDTVPFGPLASSNVTLPADTVGLVNVNSSSNGSSPAPPTTPISNSATNFGLSPMLVILAFSAFIAVL